MRNDFNIVSNDPYFTSGVLTLLGYIDNHFQSKAITVVDVRKGKHLLESDRLHDNGLVIYISHKPINKFLFYAKNKCLGCALTLGAFIKMYKYHVILKSISIRQKFPYCQNPTFNMTERKVLELTFKGANAMDIARQLRLSHKTIYAYRGNISKKCGFQHFNQLCIYIFSLGVMNNFHPLRELVKIQNIIIRTVYNG